MVKFLFSLFKKTSLILVFLFLIFNTLAAQSNDDCLMCHDDPGLTATIQGKKVSLYITGKVLNHSVHKGLKCISCHTDANVTNFPHPVVLKPVNCGSCHKEAETRYEEGAHGQALKLRVLDAPDCKECHGTHDVLSSTDPASDRKSTRLNSSHTDISRMPSSA